MLIPLFALALAQSAPMPGPTAGAAPATVAAKAKDDPQEKMVCHTDEAELGSLIPSKRRCLTRRQWAELARDSQDALRDTQRGGFRTTGN